MLLVLVSTTLSIGILLICISYLLLCIEINAANMEIIVIVIANICKIVINVNTYRGRTRPTNQAGQAARAASAATRGKGPKAWPEGVVAGDNNMAHWGLRLRRLVGH